MNHLNVIGRKPNSFEYRYETAAQIYRILIEIVLEQINKKLSNEHMGHGFPRL